MADLTISGLPDDWTVLQGYFVWSGINDEGERGSGGIEYPFNLEDEPELHDYDINASIGMLTVARAVLIERELEMRRDEED